MSGDSRLLPWGAAALPTPAGVRGRVQGPAAPASLLPSGTAAGRAAFSPRGPPRALPRAGRPGPPPARREANGKGFNA